MTSQIWINNSEKTPRMVVIEPMAIDEILLAPGESLMIVAVGREGNTESPWFSLCEWEDCSQVHLDQADAYYVERDGRRFGMGGGEIPALEMGR